LGLLKFSSRELALVSLFSSLWVVSQLYLGPLIGSITHIHGIANRVMGWMLMFLLASLTARFGRVTMMATISALATRALRRSFSAYSLTVGLGYALGGLVFDLLFISLNRTQVENPRGGSLALAALISGFLASVPYLAYKFLTLGHLGFLVMFPNYAYSLIRNVILSVLGVSLGVFVFPRLNQLH
jgi:hypothetical protein